MCFIFFVFVEETICTVHLFFFCTVHFVFNFTGTVPYETSYSVYNRSVSDSLFCWLTSLDYLIYQTCVWYRREEHFNLCS